MSTRTRQPSSISQSASEAVDQRRQFVGPLQTDGVADAVEHHELGIGQRRVQPARRADGRGSVLAAHDD